MIQYNPISSASLLTSQIQEFREIFSLVDEDQGGSINAEELMQLTELMNMGATDEEVERFTVVVAAKQPRTLVVMPRSKCSGTWEGSS